MTCLTEGCDRTNLAGRGLCRTCYNRARRRGVLASHPKIRTRSTATCAVGGCDRTVTKLALCNAHYLRQYRHGSTDERIYRGPSHPSWMDDNIGYAGAHDRVRATRGPAGDHTCVDCGLQAKEWAYRHDSPREMIGPASTGTGREPRMLPYSPDPADYDPRCIRCHRRYDEVALKRWATTRLALSR